MEVRRRGAVARRLRGGDGGKEGEEAEGRRRRRHHGHRLVSLCTLHTFSQYIFCWV